MISHWLEARTEGILDAFLCPSLQCNTLHFTLHRYTSDDEGRGHNFTVCVSTVVIAHSGEISMRDVFQVYFNYRLSFRENQIPPASCCSCFTLLIMDWTCTNTNCCWPPHWEQTQVAQFQAPCQVAELANHRNNYVISVFIALNRVLTASPGARLYSTKHFLVQTEMCQ